MWEEEGALGLETKFCRVSGVTVGDDAAIEGYASMFGALDQGGDAVQPGAFAASLLAGRKVKMLWQHDPAQPIGVWDDVREDQKGLWVRGRLLIDVAKGREAAALVAAGAIDGLSIGFRTKKAERDGKGRRLLTEVELWEVSLVTFPMLTQARVGAKGTSPEDIGLRDVAEALHEARRLMARD